MKRYLKVVALLSGLMVFCYSSFAQEAPKKINPEQKKAPGNIKIEQKHPSMRAHRAGMPYQVRSILAFYKFADELQLTDDQIIQLRGYYKKHFAKKSEKLDKPAKPSLEELCNMTEDQMNSFAEAQANFVKTKIMSALQKIIDIKKILSPEQLQKLKTMAIEAKKDKKNSEKNKDSKKIKFQTPGYFNPSQDFGKKNSQPCMMNQMRPMGPRMPGHGPCMMNQMRPMGPRMPGHGPCMMNQMHPMGPCMPGHSPCMMNQMHPMGPCMPGHGPCMMNQMRPMGPRMPGHGPCMMNQMRPMGPRMPGHGPCMMNPMPSMGNHYMPGRDPFMKNKKVDSQCEQNCSKMLEKQLLNILKKYLSCQNETKSGKINK